MLIDQCEMIIADLPVEHRAAARAMQEALVEMVCDGDADDETAMLTLMRQRWPRCCHAAFLLTWPRCLCLTPNWPAHRARGSRMRLAAYPELDKVNYSPLKELWHSDLASTPDNQNLDMVRQPG